MTRRKDILSWAIKTTLAVLLSSVIGLVLLLILLSFTDIFDHRLRLSLISKLLSSIALIEIFFFGVKESLNHSTIKKQNSEARIVFGWILILISVAVFIWFAISMCDIMIHRLSIPVTQETKSQYYVTIMGLWLYSGISILLPGICMNWGYYILKSGPMHSAIWKRILIAVLYITVTIIVFFSILASDSMTWISVFVVFLFMMTLIVIQTDYRQDENEMQNIL